MSTASFERHRDWQRAARLVRRVYRLTAGFPVDEKSGLTAHLRRTAIALPAKMAEAIGTDHEADVARALQATREGLRELISGLGVARRLRFASPWRVWLARRQLQAFDRCIAAAARRRGGARPTPHPRRQPALTFRGLRRAA